MIRKYNKQAEDVVVGMGKKVMFLIDDSNRARWYEQVLLRKLLADTHVERPDILPKLYL